MTKWLFGIILLLQVLGILSIKLHNQHSLNSKTYSFKKDKAAPSQKQVQYINEYAIVEVIPRKGDPSFIEGLTFKDANTLVESAGLYGESSIRYVNAQDMSVIQQTDLDPEFFAEGCEIVRNKDGTETIFQLTYHEKKVLLWDSETLELKEMIDAPSEIVEGWGMTKRIDNATGEVRLYISDGTNRIHIVDPETFEIIKSLEIFDEKGKKLIGMNELELVRGKLWANVFGSSNVVVINPDTGVLEAVIDFSILKKKAEKERRKLGMGFDMNAVLNGIAYHPETDRLLLTGKWWPLMFEINIQGI